MLMYFPSDDDIDELKYPKYLALLQFYDSRKGSGRVL